MADAAQLLKKVKPSGAATAVAAMGAETMAERLAGRRPSRLRALVVSAAAGIGASVGTYKLLRSGAGEKQEKDAASDGSTRSS